MEEIEIVAREEQPPQEQPILTPGLYTVGLTLKKSATEIIRTNVKNYAVQFGHLVLTFPDGSVLSVTMEALITWRAELQA